MKLLYYIYQVIIYIPIGITLTLLTALTTLIGSAIGFPHVFGYYPPKIWSFLMIRLLFLPVKVTGTENTRKGTSYVFVANHQGMYDVFLIFAYLGHNFRWMMKQSIHSIPFVGWACAASGHIFINRTSPQSIQSSIEKTHKLLKQGKSVMVFPEGTRTTTGRIGRFKRGAFFLANELQLPVVPLTIEGSYDVLPKGGGFIKRHTLKLTVHKPIFPQGKSDENMKYLLDESYRVIKESLPEKEKS